MGKNSIPRNPLDPSKLPVTLDLHAEVDKLLEPYDSPASPGCAVAVIKDGRIIYKRGYGMADLEHDVPIRPDSVFHIASHSKQFTAAAIVLLLHDGKLSLDDDARKYVPELPDFGTPITIRHLVHHTSGLCDQWALLSLAGWRYSLDLITDQDVLDVMCAQKALNFKPGAEYRYSNTGYTLLAQIVKRASGTSFRAFTTERIFKPLGMNHTHFRDDHAEIVKNIAYGYIREKSEDEFRLSIPHFDTVGATSLLTTVEDLALWDRNFYEPKVGGPAMVRQMMERGRLNNGKETDYSFGLVHGTYRGETTVFHGGADAGYRADVVRFPGQRFSVACLCNMAEMQPWQLCRKVADIYLASKLMEPERAVPGVSASTVHLTEQELAAFAGLYWSDEEQCDRRVDFKEGKLSLSFDSTERYDMQPVAQNRFRLEGYACEIEFRRGKAEDPLMLALSFEGGGQEQLLRGEPEFKPTPEQLSEYVGVYRGEEIEPVCRITVEDGALVLRRLKYPPVSLEPKILDNFSCPCGSIHFKADLRFVFFRDSQGRVTGFVVNFGSSQGNRFKKSAH